MVCHLHRPYALTTCMGHHGYTRVQHNNNTRSMSPCAHAGAYTAGLIDDKQMHDIVRHACPGAGACGGMYTANTMSSAIEALGMSLPYSSSIPAVDPLKKEECRRAGK